LKRNDTFGIAVLIILLIILPMSIGYVSASIFRLSVWFGITTGLMSSIVILLSLVLLLGATVRFPDHLPGPENDSEGNNKSPTYFA
jgi:hypothetical protein